MRLSVDQAVERLRKEPLDLGWVFDSRDVRCHLVMTQLLHLCVSKPALDVASWCDRAGPLAIGEALLQSRCEKGSVDAHLCKQHIECQPLHLSTDVSLKM